MNEANVTVNRISDSVEIDWGSGACSRLPNLWLRDNCDCGDCRVEQTSEKKFMLTEVPADLAPTEVEIANDYLHIIWPDGHRSRYAVDVLHNTADGRGVKPARWPEHFVPTRYSYREFLDDDRSAAAAISEFMQLGAIILSAAPVVPGTLEQLAPRLGPIRELLFDRIHDVRVDTAGYNVAHTALALPPHNDFASYTWPPSVQALHMLVNETPGGESIIVDGWEVLGALRDEYPPLFEVLCTMPVPFREFDQDTETYTVAPLVRREADGNISGIRFSNQLMQSVDPGQPQAGEFYRAYRELCCRIIDPAARSAFRLHGGEILIVAAHRVLHGREAFEPTGKRHLQDAYFELDNIRNQLYLLRRGEVA